MIDIFIGIFLGVLFGTLTGLLPSLHPNNLIAILLSFLPFFLNIFTLNQLIAFIVSLSITHSFTSFLASVLFGIPEEETSLSVLPSHKLTLEGKAYEAVFLTVFGGLISSIFALIFLPILLNIFPLLYKYSLRILPFILILVLSHLILIQKDKLKALLVVIFAGLLGYFTLNLYFLKSTEKLTSLFTGLFGLSTIIVSLTQKASLPKQTFEIKIKDLYLKESFIGFLASILIILFPSLSPSQSIIILQSIFKINDPRAFLVSLGGLTTVDSIASFLSLYSLGNPRSGASVAIEYLLGKIDYNTFLLILGIILFTIPLASYITLFLAKLLLQRIQKANYFKLNLFLVVLTILMITLTSNSFCLIVLLASTSLGILAHLWGVNKSLLVSVLMVPTLISFLNF